MTDYQVLFTADLKSFSTFGLPSPSPSASPEKVQNRRAAMLTPSPSPSPRKRKVAKDEEQGRLTQPLSVDLEVTAYAESDALVDRVKKRRRTIIPKYKRHLPPRQKPNGRRSGTVAMKHSSLIDIA